VLDNVAGDDDIKLLINREIVQPFDISTDYVVEYRKPAQLFNNMTAAIDADHIRTLTELPMQALFGRPNPLFSIKVCETNATQMKNRQARTDFQNKVFFGDVHSYLLVCCEVCVFESAFMSGLPGMPAIL